PTPADRTRRSIASETSTRRQMMIQPPTPIAANPSRATKHKSPHQGFTVKPESAGNNCGQDLKNGLRLCGAYRDSTNCVQEAIRMTIATDLQRGAGTLGGFSNIVGRAPRRIFYQTQ